MQFHIDLDGEGSLQRRIYLSIRDRILSGKLVAGARLPSSRGLSRLLGVSRNAVAIAYDRLVADGFVNARSRTGMFVSLQVPDVPSEGDASPAKAGTLSARIDELGQLGSSLPRKNRPFEPGLPALEMFPFEIWARLSGRRWRGASAAQLDYGDAFGYPPLRRAISDYLRIARGVHCSPENVLVCSGTQIGIHLAALATCNQDDAAWVEDPGYAGARRALVASGIRYVALPVDSYGIVVDEGIRRAPAARIAFVTPSHQYPSGVVLAPARRIQLLDWAAREQSWIFEDDYDSEFQFARRPLTSLYAMAADMGHRSIIYAGTFSKTLFPSLRLAYLVIPDAARDAFVRLRSAIDRHPPTLDQATLSDFIAEGHYGRHLRRMRILYEERAVALREAIEDAGLEDHLELSPINGGMQAAAWLRGGEDVQRWLAAATRADVMLRPIGASHPNRQGFILGFSGFSNVELQRAAQRLAEVLRLI